LHAGSAEPVVAGRQVEQAWVLDLGRHLPSTTPAAGIDVGHSLLVSRPSGDFVGGASGDYLTRLGVWR
jgi:hypothetical protein